MAAFTTIATAAGLAATAAGTAQSFAQAGKQKRMQAKAEAEAQKALDEAKRTLGVNYMEAVGIAKEPYELQREAMLSAGAQSIEAAREGERGAAATAGRVYALQQQGQEKIASEMAQDIATLEKQTADESRRIADKLAGISQEEAAGAQLAARNYEQMANQSMEAGFKGLTSVAQQAAQFVPLYERSQSARAFNQVGADNLKTQLSQSGIANEIKKVYGVDVSSVPTDANKFMDFMTNNFTADQIKKISQMTIAQPQKSTGVLMSDANKGGFDYGFGLGF